MSFEYVKIHYGPVQSFGLNPEHKPQYLYGLRDCLRVLGFRVDLFPVNYINYCVIEMCGHLVFKCNLKNLGFNSKDSYICQKAVRAVQKATVKLVRARTYLWLWKLIQSEIFHRTKYAPRDLFLPDLPPVQDMASLQVCTECCGLALKPDEARERNLHFHDTFEGIHNAPDDFDNVGEDEMKLNLKQV